MGTLTVPDTDVQCATGTMAGLRTWNLGAGLPSVDRMTFKRLAWPTPQDHPTFPFFRGPIPAHVERLTAAADQRAKGRSGFCRSTVESTERHFRFIGSDPTG